MPAVATTCLNWFWPTNRSQPVYDSLSTLFGCSQFLIGGRNTSRTLGVQVNQEPVTSNNFGIGCGHVSEFSTVFITCEKFRLHRIHRHVNGLMLAVEPGDHRRSTGIIVEVSGYRARLRLWNADFINLILREDDIKRGLDHQCWPHLIIFFKHAFSYLLVAAIAA